MHTSCLLYERLRIWAARQPEAPFIIEAETGTILTYSQSLAGLEALRHLLGTPSRRILLALPGGMANAIVWLSALTGGHTLVPVDPEAPPQEIMRTAALFPPEVLVVKRAEDAESFSQQGQPLLTQSDCETLIQSARPPRSGILPPVEGRACFRTSGSTGQPKHVLLGGQHISWTATQIHLSHHLSPEDRGLAVLPFFHVNAPVVSLCASLLAGGAVVIAPHFSRDHFWPWIDHYRITWASIVPTILAMVLQSERPASPSSTLRFVRTASAPLPALQLLQFERQFGVPVLETYGLTEAASQVCANPFPPERHVPGSVGKPVGVDLRICRVPAESKHGLQDVPHGEPGEICIAGPSVISAYVGESATEAFQGDWFHTGDLGYQDAEGFLYLIGRLRDVIIRGGESIAPREIEEVLLAHPAVLEAAVIGRPDDLYGEQVVAFVVTRETWSSTLEQRLRVHCGEYLSRYKIPVAFIHTDVLPRTINGKLDRQSLHWQVAPPQKTPEVSIHAA